MAKSSQRSVRRVGSQPPGWRSCVGGAPSTTIARFMKVQERAARLTAAWCQEVRRSPRGTQRRAPLCPGASHAAIAHARSAARGGARRRAEAAQQVQSQRKL